MNATKPTLSSELVMSALGKGVDDVALHASFSAVGLTNWPSVDDEREGALNVEYWRFGFSLLFLPTREYEPLYDSSGVQGPLVSYTVVFHSGNGDGFRRFEAALPFGLSFDASAEEVASILGAPTASRTPYDRVVALFVLDSHVVNVCYDHSLSRIDFVEVRYKNTYEKNGHPSSGLDWNDFVPAIGRSADDQEVLESLTDLLNAPVLAEELKEFECVTYRKRYGLTFYSSAVEELNWQELSNTYSSATRIVTGVKFQRAGDTGSGGYQGTLPFGLEFSDNPSVALDRLPVIAHSHHYQGGGYYGVVYDGKYFHVEFSLVFWQILSISVFHASLSPGHIDGAA